MTYGVRLYYQSGFPECLLLSLTIFDNSGNILSKSTNEKILAHKGCSHRPIAFNVLREIPYKIQGVYFADNTFFEIDTTLPELSADITQTDKTNFESPIIMISFHHDGKIKVFCGDTHAIHAVQDLTSSKLNIDEFTKRKFINRLGLVSPNEETYHTYKTYTYKYLVDFKITNDQTESIVRQISAYQYDGAYNKSYQLKYLNLGKPFRVKIEWSHNKANFSADIYFILSEISGIFERFYGVHQETKTDFIIRIDAENKKYELALFRQGLKEPVIIPESAYQLIVFKNQFEDYRSENYNQPSGAWIW